MIGRRTASVHAAPCTPCTSAATDSFVCVDPAVTAAVHSDAYRLCPKREGSLVTETCFQRHHLKFASNLSWIQYGSDRANRTAFEAMRVSAGTMPVGSTFAASDSNSRDPYCSTPPSRMALYTLPSSFPALPL